MSRPKNVFVGHLKYQISYDHESLQASKARELEDLTGHCANDKLQITVDGSMAEPNVRDVLMHEILHACHWSAGEPLGHMKSDDPEEDAIRILAPALLNVLRANPKLVEYLLG